MTVLRPLPGGTNDLVELRARNELYIDKTAYLADLLDGYSKYCFLARPRRFGKSLLVSTLEHLFQGRTELFRATAIHDRAPRSPNWIWPTPAPVIRLNMNDWRNRDAETLNAGLLNHLDQRFDAFQLPRPRLTEDAAVWLSALLSALAAARGKAVVLIDEYDHPLLHNLDKPVLPDIQDFLASFYGLLKNHDADLRFVFITGVTRFARTSIFSGLNNLRDISHERQFNGLLGFTQAEVTRHLHPYMTDMTDEDGNPLADAPARLREYYNGYRFAKGVPDAARVYNPYSILTSLNTKILSAYWTETGIPFFLPQLLEAHACNVQDVRHKPSDMVLKGILTPRQLAEAWQSPRNRRQTDPDSARAALTKIMFQTGYLTLVRSRTNGGYVTDFPNMEVTESFVQDLLPYMLAGEDYALTHVTDICDAVRALDPVAMRKAGNRLMASLTYLEHTPQETYYQTLLHVALLALQYQADVQAEVILHRGRPDIVVALENEVVILELKMDDAAETPLGQAEKRAYARRFTDQGKTVHVWGLTIGRDEREILDITHKSLAAPAR